MKTVLAILALLAAGSAAAAQSVKDYVDVAGARSNVLRGYGLVTGLNGNGDSPAGESARLLRAMLQNLSAPNADVGRIDARSCALVLVTAELPPFQKKGTRIDVSVSALGDAKSLAGGELQLTDLRGPLGRNDPAVYALASGRLVLSGDAKRGNPGAASVPGGAVLERELDHAFVEDVDGRGRRVTLLLRKPDLGVASQLAAQINAGAVRGPEGKRLDVASALDGGSVRVRVPSAADVRALTGGKAEADFEAEPVRWLDRILNLPVAIAATELPAVVIHDSTKTVSWTGEVRLRAGSVMLPPAAAGARPSVFHAQEQQALSEFLDRVAPALAEQQLVDLVRALHGAGLIQGEVRSR